MNNKCSANIYKYCRIYQGDGLGEKVLIQTYGCTLNQADSRIMGSMLSENGFDIVYNDGKPASMEGYDYVIVNTCTVKRPTEQKILYRLGKIRGMGKKLIVAGCMASANRDKIEKVVPEASIITTSNIGNVVEAIDKIKKGQRAVYDTYGRVDKLAYGINGQGIIARVPISEGCLSNCSFCETKYARGPLNSFSEELILQAVKTSVENGAKEIELTAQDTGAYGLDRKTNIALLAQHAAQIEGDFRIRVGMLNPEHLHRYFDDLVDAYKSEKLYKFIHLPVQSGSNTILKKMRRNYTIEEYENYVRELRSKISGISIATDIIVGFPTETDADFHDTIALLERIRPEVTNVSMFGARPHAEASRMPQLSNTIIKKRSVSASRTARKIQYELHNELLQKVESVLITEENARSLTGRDDSYRSVAIGKESGVRLGDRIRVRIEGATSACLIGKMP